MLRKIITIALSANAVSAVARCKKAGRFRQR